MTESAPARATLPKAYLRLDPNIDQTHADPGAMVTLMCAANRQPHRGRFRSRAIAEKVCGRKIVTAALGRGDLEAEADGRLYLVGWDEWQEGDWTVGERQKRIRNRRNGVTSDPLPERDTVTVEPLHDRAAPSEALGRKGFRAEDVLSDALTAPANGHDPTDAEWNRLRRLFMDLTGQAYPLPNRLSGYGATAWAWMSLPWSQVESAVRSVASTIDGTPTVKQLVFGAEDVLHPVPRMSGNPKQAKADEKAAILARLRGTN